MPEYSSTTITPADGVKTPAMNGSTSGNYTLDALRNYILASKGLANGLATLGSDGKLTSSQLPDLADDVIVVASYSVLPATGTAGKIYITADTNIMYRWDADLATPDYVELSTDLSAYATKAELTTEANTRSAADTNLKSAIQSNSARIENLEQKAGGYSVVQYRGTNAVPTGKAKYGLVEKIVGKSREWNNVFDPSKYASSATINGITFTNNGDGTITLSGTASAEANFSLGQQFKIVNGTSYILGSGIAKSGVYLSNNYTSALKVEGVAYDYKTDDYTSASLATFYLTVDSGTVISTPITAKPMLRNLELIFPEGVPASASACVAKCPSILDYDAYGYSLVDTVVEGVKSVGVNLWDEEWELDGSSLVSKNYIPVPALKELYFKIPTGWLTVTEYDADKNQIGSLYSIGNNTHTTASNCAYMKFMVSSGYGSTYNHDIQISEVHGSVSTVNTTHHPYMTDTLSFPSVSLKSAGSVAEEFDLESGEKTNPIGVADLGTECSWSVKSGATVQWYSWSLENLIKRIGGDTKPNMVCAILSPATYNDSYSSGLVDASICVGDSGQIGIMNSAWQGKSGSEIEAIMVGYKLYYELETPLSYEQVCDPVINNTIQTEGGGTINTIQTQTTKIDNCLDVGYLTL